MGANQNIETPKLSNAEILMYSTVLITVVYPNGKKGVGTGFFVGLCENTDYYQVCLVTNRHVIDGTKSQSFRMTERSSVNGPPIASQMEMKIDDVNEWIVHPQLDLAVFAMSKTISDLGSQGKYFIFTVALKAEFATVEQLRDLAPCEEVIMIGYPRGIYDDVNYRPIFRKGITATHPGDLYQGRPEFLIDASCVRGSSGSPVWLLNEGTYMDKHGNTYLGDSRICLLGVLYAGPTIDIKGNVRLTMIPVQEGVANTSQVLINLGNVIRADHLLDFEPLLRARYGIS